MVLQVQGNLKILFFTDVHFSNKAPSSRLDDYRLSILNKMEEIAAMSGQYDVALCGGDIFHSSVIAIEAAIDLVRVLNKFKCPLYITSGNHDFRGHNVENIKNSMIGMLYESGVIRPLLSATPLNVLLDDKEILIEGRPYKADMDKNPSNYSRGEKKDFNILVAHGELTNKKMPEFINHVLIKDVPCPANLTLSGHDHTGFGIDKVGDNIFANIGSVARTASSEKHIPSILDININSNLEVSLNKIQLKSALIYDKIFSQREDTEIGQDFAMLVNAAKRNDIVLDYNSYLASVEGEVKEEVMAIAKDYIKKAEQANDNSYSLSYKKKSCKVYIKEIKLRNFMTYKEETTVKFHEGFNMIVGQNGAGKSTIFRAISWVLYNDFSGDGFVRKGAKDCEVTIILSDGSYVRKYKKGKDVSYFIPSSSTGKEEEYKGFGNNFPQEIINVHQMLKVNLYKEKLTKINYNTQYEYFLINEVPSEKAEAIGMLTKANITDGAIGIVSQDIRAIKSEGKATLSEKEAKSILLEEATKEYDKYNSLYSRAEKLCKFRDTLLMLSQKINKIFYTKKEIIFLKNEIMNISESIRRYNDFKEPTLLLKVYDFKIKLCNTINTKQKLQEEKSFLDKVSLVTKDKSKKNEILLQLILIASMKEEEKLVREKVLSLQIPQVKDVSTLQIKRLLTLKQLVLEYSERYNELLKINNNILESTKDLENIDCIINKLYSDLETFGVCPKCGQRLNGEAITFLKEN